MRGHKPRNENSLSKLEKVRKCILPESLQKGTSPADIEHTDKQGTVPVFKEQIFFLHRGGDNLGN